MRPFKRQYTQSIAPQHHKIPSAIIWFLFFAPGACLLWFNYMWPSKGQLWASKRRAENRTVQFIYTVAIYVSVPMFLVALTTNRHAPASRLAHPAVTPTAQDASGAENGPVADQGKPTASSVPIEPRPSNEAANRATGNVTVGMPITTPTIDQPQDIQTDPPPAVEREDKGLQGLYDFVDLANIRTGPSKTSPVVAIMSPGQFVTIVETRGSWARVSSEGQIVGWVHRSLIVPR